MRTFVNLALVALFLHAAPVSTQEPPMTTTMTPVIDWWTTVTGPPSSEEDNEGNKKLMWVNIKGKFMMNAAGYVDPEMFLEMMTSCKALKEMKEMLEHMTYMLDMMMGQDSHTMMQTMEDVLWMIVDMVGDKMHDAEMQQIHTWKQEMAHASPDRKMELMGHILHMIVMGAHQMGLWDDEDVQDMTDMLHEMMMCDDKLMKLAEILKKFVCNLKKMGLMMCMEYLDMDNHGHDDIFNGAERVLPLSFMLPLLWLFTRALF